MSRLSSNILWNLAGQVVLSGALTEAVPVSDGDVIVARFDRLGTIELACR